jgi:hypothetical protein
MPSTSLSGYVYYVSFIDDYSRKTWVYFLKSKDEVLGKFKEFKALVENISERKIKILRSDNGGEYTSNEFGIFCREFGIWIVHNGKSLSMIHQQSGPFPMLTTMGNHCSSEISIHFPNWKGNCSFWTIFRTEK